MAILNTPSKHIPHRMCTNTIEVLFMVLNLSKRNIVLNFFTIQTSWICCILSRECMVELENNDVMASPFLNIF